MPDDDQNVHLHLEDVLQTLPFAHLSVMASERSGLCPCFFLTECFLSTSWGSKVATAFSTQLLCSYHTTPFVANPNVLGEQVLKQSRCLPWHF